MKLCVALDADTKEANLALAHKLKGLPIWLKVGFRSFLRNGWDFLEELRAIDGDSKLFLDLKLYDIPNTMADGAEEICQKGLCDMFNVHASAGVTAMQTVMNRLSNYDNRPLVLAVTALTSFSEEEFYNIYNNSINVSAPIMAYNAFSAGLDGVVCSAHESLAIKHATSMPFLTLTPGIRPFGEASDDQARVANIPYALSQNVDFAVVGRPIYRSEDPRGVAEKILFSLS